MRRGYRRTQLTPSSWTPVQCPPSYQVLHRHRGTSADQRGGGVALVYHDVIKATTIDVGDYTEFESLAVKLTGRCSNSWVVVCVHRPPATVTSAFTDQLSDIFDQVVLLRTTLCLKKVPTVKLSVTL